MRIIDAIFAVLPAIFLIIVVVVGSILLYRWMDARNEARRAQMDAASHARLARMRDKEAYAAHIERERERS